MRSRTLTIAAALALLAGLACGRDSKDSPDVSAADVVKQAKEAVDTAADYAAARRRQLTERAQQSFDQLSSEISDARGELQQLPNEVRPRVEQALERAERARARVGEQLDELREAGAESWEAAQKRLSDAVDEMDEARAEVEAALAGRSGSG